MEGSIVVGGYVCFTTMELWELCRRASQRDLSLLALRSYLACREMVERRIQATGPVRYGLAELCALTGADEKPASNALADLHGKRLVTFAGQSIEFEHQHSNPLVDRPFGTNPGRLVPIPRRMLRTLCQHGRRMEIVVALIHCARGLFLRKGKVVAWGAVKSSWIQSHFGVGRTVVTSARSWLRALGFLLPQEDVAQWRRNRYGYYFKFACGKLKVRKRRQTAFKPKIGTPYKQTPFINIKPNQYCTTKGRPYDVRAGISRETKLKHAKPNIRNVQFRHLSCLGSVLELYRQAVAIGLLADSEANRINFVAAAVRATRAPNGDKVRIFMGIVRRGLWHYITMQQEGRAVELLKAREAKRSTQPGPVETRVAKVLQDAVSALPDIDPRKSDRPLSLRGNLPKNPLSQDNRHSSRVTSSHLPPNHSGSRAHSVTCPISRSLPPASERLRSEVICQGRAMQQTHKRFDHSICPVDTLNNSAATTRE